MFLEYKIKFALLCGHGLQIRAIRCGDISAPSGLPVLTHMDPLDRETLRAILTEPKNALIKQYQKLFLMDEVAFSITEEALDFVVDKALEYKLGARGLRSLCEAILTDAMYDLPSSDEKTLEIDREYAEHSLSKNLLKRLEIAS